MQEIDDVDFFLSHPEILTTIYKHFDNYNMCMCIKFFFKRSKEYLLIFDF